MTRKRIDSLLDEADDEELFEFPDVPERIPDWAIEEAEPWRKLDRWGIEERAESICGRSVEIRSAPLPASVWGLHIARGGRVRLCVNEGLPWPWSRFAIFHELYHLLSHPAGGEAFWKQTFHPMSHFENEADMFAWAAVRDDFDTAW